MNKVRVTIMIDDSLKSRIHRLQGEHIAKTDTNISFSTVLTNLVKKGMKK